MTKNRNETFGKTANQKKSDMYDLWEMTRTDDIENNFEKYHIYDTKEIAAIIRKHLRERFPMCKWTIVKDRDSIYLHLLSSPWKKDSDEVKAIVRYAYVFAQSYNYNHSDSMSDYFNVNFYGVYESNIVDYRYEQREATVSEYNISDNFHIKKSAFEKSEQERKEKELQEYMAKEEIERAEAAKREEENKARHNIIENGAKVKEVSYFVLGCDATNTRKENNISGYTDDSKFEIKHHRENCHISKEVYFNSEVYELFVNQLLDDYSFLAGMGGSTTDDLRITTMTDYQMMTEKERQTVEWYNNNCVAIYCDNELKLVIDPQGYDYARYVFFVDSESKIVDTYHTAYGVDYDEVEENRKLADKLYDASTDIIIENELIGKWDNEYFEKYKQLIKEWIRNNDFPLTVGVVRAISDESDKFKMAMYKLLTEINGIQEQFLSAGLVENQKITMVNIGDFGGISISRVTFKRFECGKYAQYNDAVKVIYRPERKRNTYYTWLYKDVLIFNGWVDIPKNILWDISKRNNKITIYKSKFMSCDHAQYDAVLEYFKSNGIKPIINTYKP